MSDRKIDQKLYRELGVPFATVEEANDEFKQFQDELYVLRRRHRVRDLVFIAQLAVIYEDGTEGSPLVAGMYGDEMRAEGMAAFALGRFSAERQERVAQMIDASAGLKSPRRR